MKAILWLLLLATGCSAQPATERKDRAVGGPCEGCEAVYEYGERILTSTDTLPGFASGEPKMLLTGTIFQLDGVTPAPNVVLYAYHTDRNGIYPADPDSGNWGRRHGRHRGWIKTDADGGYAFYTIRPASYPNRRAPEHVHLTVKEPGLSPYYLDDFFFTDDPLLTEEFSEQLGNRGGSGIITLVREGQLLVGRRDLVLGRNIPGY